MMVLNDITWDILFSYHRGQQLKVLPSLITAFRQSLLTRSKDIIFLSFNNGWLVLVSKGLS